MLVLSPLDGRHAGHREMHHEGTVVIPPAGGAKCCRTWSTVANNNRAGSKDTSRLSEGCPSYH